jgi:hypothetical protein
VPNRRRSTRCGCVDPLRQVAAVAGIVQGRTAGQDPRPVSALPPEDGARQVLLFARLGTEEDIVAQATAAQDLRQATGVPKRVDVIAGHSALPKHRFECALPIQAVPDKGLATGDVAVRLDPPAVDQCPASLGDALLDRGKEGGVILLHPTVGRGAAAAKDVAVSLLHQRDRRAIGREDFFAALLEAPQPHWIDVGVADHMYDGPGHARPLPALSNPDARPAASPTAARHRQ